jgi:hypothetical protein
VQPRRASLSPAGEEGLPRVIRALTADARRKPTLSQISDAWNKPHVSYEFRVRPIAGNSEMLFVQSDKADFAPPAMSRL